MVEIYVATHKLIPFELPTIYKKIQVNCANNMDRWPGYYHDDFEENISQKNPSYCELTALYSEWKNSKADIKGLVHYRRYFVNDNVVRYHSFFLNYSWSKLLKNLLREENVSEILEKYDIILPLPYLPYPRTASEDLEIYCYKKDVDVFKEIIEGDSPDYYDCFVKTMQSRNLSYCNMFITRKEIFDDYCEWIFKILKEVENSCDISNYDKQHKRIYGYLSEVLINTYAEKNKLKVKYLNVAQPFEFLPTIKPIRYHLSNVLWNSTLLRESLGKLFYKEKYDQHCRMHDKCLEKAAKVDMSVK